MNNYERLILANVSKLYGDLPPDLGAMLLAERQDNRLFFRAFGENCSIGEDGVYFSGRPDVGPKGLLISLYANYARPDPLKLQPFRAFKELPGSMPYQGAFSANAERVLLPYVHSVHSSRAAVMEAFGGRALSDMPGDFSFVLYPLPKIALCYIFFLADEEFPASVSCLFSANAHTFMPLDGLADVGEYTSKRIIELGSSGSV